MLIDVTKKLKDFDGDILPLQVDQNKPAREMTVKSLSVTLLTTSIRNETIPADDMLSRFTLAQRIHDAKKPIELDSEEVSLILELVSRGFGPLVYGRMIQFLDPGRLRKKGASVPDES